jgi:hypothetical protein
MDACLVALLLYFLAPPGLVCLSDAEVASQETKDKAYEKWRSSLDFSFLEKPYAKCKMDKPTRALSAQEQCYISKLSARCSEADDCLVQCIGSGMNDKVGGGCWHLCFETKFDLSKWSEPKGWGVCTRASVIGS